MALIPLSQVSGEVRLRFGSTSVTYQRLHRLAADGRLPITRIGGRIFIEDAKLGAVAAMFAAAPDAPRNAA